MAPVIHEEVVKLEVEAERGEARGLNRTADTRCFISGLRQTDLRLNHSHFGEKAVYEALRQQSWPISLDGVPRIVP
ncbi:unnamed protein product [Boreogadus saida]